MDESLPLPCLSLTPNMNSDQAQLPETPPSHAASLPHLKEIVGSAYHAQRPLQPAPLPTVPEFFVPGVSTIYIDNLPIRTYTICGVNYNMAQPFNETRSKHVRVTMDHRRLTYTLEVVQQPEKARACGSGPRCTYHSPPISVFAANVRSIR